MIQNPNLKIKVEKYRTELIEKLGPEFLAALDTDADNRTKMPVLSNAICEIEKTKKKITEENKGEG